MRIQPIVLLVVPLVVVLSACDDGDSVQSLLTGQSPASDDRIAVVSGDGQTGRAGEDLPQPFVVRVTDAGGRERPRISVQWSVVQGNGCMSTPDGRCRTTVTTATDANGLAGLSFYPIALGPSIVRAQLGEASAAAVTLASVAEGVRIKFGPVNGRERFDGPGVSTGTSVPAGTSVKVQNLPTTGHPVRLVVTPPAGPPIDLGELPPGGSAVFTADAPGGWHLEEGPYADGATLTVR